MLDVYANRRREPRVHLLTHVTVSGLNQYGESFSYETVTVDVSPHGASFAMEPVVASGTVLDFRTIDYTFSTKAIVRTIDRDRNTGMAIIGIEYLDDACNPVVIWGS